MADGSLNVDDLGSTAPEDVTLEVVFDAVAVRTEVTAFGYLALLRREASLADSRSNLSEVSFLLDL